MTDSKKQGLKEEEKKALFKALKTRFENYPERHLGIEWAQVKAKLETKPEELLALHEMEKTGGEPDVVDFEKGTGVFTFCDCSAESPKGRRSLCYDGEALEARKEHKPSNSAVDMANEMGIELLDEEHYRFLQKFGPFDTKTSSWLTTPQEIRGLGGAIFGDYRYGKVFIYHNGAESYYAARGFRGMLRV